MAKLKIGIDFDDVIMDTFPEFLAFCNERHGESFRVEEFTSFGYDEVWKITKTEFIERFTAFDNSEAKKKIQPMRGAQEVIAKLTERYELHIVTARPVEVSRNTHEMIDGFFPGIFQEVHFCSSDNGAVYHRPKPLVCKEIGTIVHIEDHPETAKACAQEGVPVLLFDRTWNRSAPAHDSITRAHSWDEIFEILCQR